MTSVFIKALRGPTALIFRSSRPTLSSGNNAFIVRYFTTNLFSSSLEASNDTLDKPSTSVSSQELLEKIGFVVCTPIRPLSINEILTLHTGPILQDSQSQTTSVVQPEKEIDTSLSCAMSVSNHGGGTAYCRPSVISKHDNKATWESLLLRSANWARQEIPRRLAHRLHDFSRLPFAVVSNEHVYEVYQLYCEAFQRLTNFGEVKDLESEKHFTQQLRDSVTAHSNVVALMQRGISSLKQTHEDISLDDFLDRLFGTRIGNRVLAETHLALHSNPEWFEHSAGATFFVAGAVNPTLGAIQKYCRPADVLSDVAIKVQQLAMYTYGCAPEVSIIGETELTFPYIPEHLRFICFEILKNSVRATIENQSQTLKSKSLPPILVGIHKGRTDVVIKVIDQGGGLSEDFHDDIWQYGFSTVSHNKPIKDQVKDEKKQMAGYGFGLPLSRLYARYFGGNLDIKFMAGYGSDAYIFLPRLGNQKESEEILNNRLFLYTKSNFLK